MTELSSDNGWPLSETNVAPKSEVYPLLFRAWAERLIEAPNQAGAHHLRQLLGAAAWRLVCRSRARDIIAAIHDGAISLDRVFEFLRLLVADGWQQLPSGHLLNAHIACSRRVFVSAPRLPGTTEQLSLLWLAERGGATTSEYMIVCRWAGRMKIRLSRANEWHAIKRRAMAWHQSGQADEVVYPLWHFYCGDVAWRGYTVVPIRSPSELWEEGAEMAHCVYDLRALCDTAWPSRFFSLKRAGRRVGTVELSLIPPEAGMQGLNRTRGRWILMDCRLSANRVPRQSLAIDMLEFGNQYDSWSMRPGRAPHPLDPSVRDVNSG